MGDDVLDQHLLLGAEATADAGLDHPDVLDLHVDEGGQHPAGVERNLGGGADHHALVGVEPRHRDVGLNGALLDLVHPEGLLEGVGCGREVAVDVAALGRQVVHQVALGVADVGGVVLVVDLGGVGVHGKALVEHGRQDLVFDLDEAHGLLGGLDGLGGHRGDPVADVSDPVVEAHLVVGVGVGPALPAGCVLDPGRVAVMQHRVDPLDGPGRRVVDAQDAGVGVRAAQHLGVQHPPGLHVVGEGRVALGQPHRVHLDLGLADHGHVGHLLRRHQPGHCMGRFGSRAAGGRLGGRPIAVGERLDDQRCERLGLLAPEHRRRPLDGLHRLHVGGLAVEDAREHVPDLVLGRVGVLLQQGERAEDHRTRGVAGLEGSDGHECGLDGMQVRRDVERLDGGDPVAVGGGGQDHVGGGESPVVEHRGRAGLTAVGAEVDREHAQPAQGLPQRVMGLDGQGGRSAVEFERDVDGHGYSSCITRAVSVTARCRRYSRLPLKSPAGSRPAVGSCTSTSTGWSATPVRAMATKPSVRRP